MAYHGTSGFCVRVRVLITNYIGPALLALFGASFLGGWSLMREGKHLLFFALAFLLFAAGAFCQIASWPADLGQNAVLSAALYCAGALSFGEGVLRRSGKSAAPSFHALSMLTLVGAIVYFFYIDRNLTVRVYILNFGLGALLLAFAWRARFLLRGSAVDRTLFWLLVIVGLHFFPRTVLTASHFIDGRADAFATTDFWAWVKFSLAIAGAGAGLGLFVVIGADVILTLRKERDFDPLTGVLNRRGIAERVERRLTARPRSNICVVICDIDNFKGINDNFGHAAGDEVLASFAKIAAGKARAGDLVGRLGGEEFVVVLNGISLRDAFHFTERLRREIAQASFAALPDTRRVTCSFGLVELREGESLHQAIDRADCSLYAAKRAGRNRTIVEGLQVPHAA